MRRRPTIWRFALLVPALMVTGCGDDTADDPPDTTTTTSTNDMTDASLENTLWLLASVGADDAAVVAGTNPTLQFLPGGRYSADTGCNIANGAYSTSGDDGLRLESGQMTQRACADDAANQQELTITGAFDATRSTGRGDGDRLSLLDGSGVVLLTYAGQSTDLAGTQWQVSGVNTGSAVETTALTEQLTLEFGATDQVSGNAGCNSFTGTYTVAGDDLTFGALASTEMACEPEVMTLEQRYLAALEKVTSFRRTGASVDLLDEAGATQVSLIPPNR